MGGTGIVCKLDIAKNDSLDCCTSHLSRDAPNPLWTLQVVAKKAWIEIDWISLYEANARQEA